MAKPKVNENERRVVVSVSIKPDLAKRARIEGAKLSMTRSQFVEMVLQARLEGEVSRERKAA